MAADSGPVSAHDALVVVQKGDHSLGYYDLHSGAELHRVSLDPFPREMALAPDGRRAYVGHFGVALAEDPGADGRTVSVVDLRRRRRVGSLDCGEYRRPLGVAVDLAGAAYVLSEGAGRLLVWRRPTSGPPDVVLATGAEGAQLFPGDPDRPPVTIPVGAGPEGSVLDEDEQRLYVACREAAQVSVIDVKRLAVASAIRTAAGPMRASHDGGGVLLVPLHADRSLAIVDMPAGLRQRRVPLPAPPVSIGYHGPSGYALVATLGHEVCVVDVKKGRVARRISTRRDPDATGVVSVSD